MWQPKRSLANIVLPAQEYVDHLPSFTWLDEETAEIEGHVLNVYQDQYDYRSLFQGR